MDETVPTVLGSVHGVRIEENHIVKLSCKVKKCLREKMEGLKQPDALKMEGDMAENWRIFSQRFGLYCSLSGACDKLKGEGQLVDLLVHCMGQEAMQVFNSLTFGQREDKKDLDTVMKKMEEHCKPKTSTMWERWQFNQLKQGEGERFDKYLANLRLKAKECKFENEDEAIRDHIVHNAGNSTLRDKLWRLEDPKLEAVIATCHS
jgi:hypothetical protein